ncbi:hypothetical protein SARC_07698 [Sphaeroforma arctica JP610]|uniref:Uncharacterized protein n=1 Tax=Sphaeroforma arctica JP610 TaxID=667725 RepID=A0A0L0FSY4_9EUKA|nr:hypothetical protein SARC_07698 [Sphaeroforma arctica JP610]KNC79927.1 hypothetical protein SARC_07698 [Sphaeroforma arctica JP610]|eukprot:XP_014153829.1 hypothetical protein SARC_07698 [Sphaeroforma arctica JP610]
MPTNFGDLSLSRNQKSSAMVKPPGRTLLERADLHLDTQDVKRCKISTPTGSCTMNLTATEMRVQVFRLTQRMMQAESEGRTEDARSLQGLIRTSK